MENKQNKKEIMEELCADTWRDLYRFIYYKVQNREEAEDITQETYVKALSFLNKSETTILEYKSFLKTIAINLIRDQWRAKQRKGEHINLETIEAGEIALDDFTDSLSEREQITQAMNQLSEEQKRVIELRIIKGYTVAETGRLMDKKEGAIRVLQLRSVRALAKILEAEQGKEKRQFET